MTDVLQDLAAIRAQIDELKAGCIRLPSVEEATEILARWYNLHGNPRAHELMCAFLEPLKDSHDLHSGWSLEDLKALVVWLEHQKRGVRP